MKKTILYLVITIIIQVNVYSQSFSGKVTYQAMLWEQKQLNLDTVKAPKQAKLLLKKMLTNTTPLIYVLKFNKSRSVFKKEEQLELKKNILLKASVGNGTFYYDRKNKLLLFDKTTFENDFLIVYPPTKWHLTNETKKINGYLCGKATTTFTEKGSKGVMKRFIVAWFAFKLPYNYGPNQFLGLPGLVLELNYIGKYKMKAVKIVLNPKEKMNIKMPKKGKRILKEEYDKKIDEMFAKRMIRYQN